MIETGTIEIGYEFRVQAPEQSVTLIRYGAIELEGELFISFASGLSTTSAGPFAVNSVFGYIVMQLNKFNQNLITTSSNEEDTVNFQYQIVQK